MRHEDDREYWSPWADPLTIYRVGRPHPSIGAILSPAPLRHGIYGSECHINDSRSSAAVNLAGEVISIVSFFLVEPCAGARSSPNALAVAESTSRPGAHGTESGPGPASEANEP